MTKWLVLAALAAGTLVGGCPPAEPVTDNSSDADTNAAAAQTPGIGPAAPSRVVPMDEAVAPTVELKWFPVGGATHYSVYAGIAQDPPHLFNLTANSYKLEQVAPCATYYWRVEAHSDTGVTSSPVWSFRTTCPTDRPDTPAYPSPSNRAYGVAVKDTGKGAPALNWQPVAKAEIYDVYFGTNRDPAYYTSSYATTLSNLPPLVEGRQYYWRVVAKNRIGESSSEEWTFTATRNAEGPPTPLSSFPADRTIGMPTRLRLDWTDSAGATGYKLYLGTEKEPAFAAETIASDFTVATEMQLATHYYWRVEAVGAKSVTSGPVWSFTTAAAPQPPLAPRSPTPAIGASGVSIPLHLEWTPIADATSYKVYLGTGGAPQLAGETPNAYFDAIDLQPVSLYFWQVVSVNAAGETEGPTWSFVTADPAADDDDQPPPWDGDDGGDGGIAGGGNCDGVIRRVNITPSGGESTSGAAAPVLSGDGRIVAFRSAADDLVSGDTNQAADIFVRDLDSGSTTRISVDSSGAESSDNSTELALSSGGRYVAFSTHASLASGDTNGAQDVYVHDRQTHLTRWVSENGTRGSGGPAISADGRFIAFYSRSTLVSGDTNSKPDVYVRDMSTGAFERVSVATGGGQADLASLMPALSSDGRFVAFASYATNLGGGGSDFDVFRHDRATGQTIYAGKPGSPGCLPAISADGQKLAFVGLSGLAFQIYFNDLSSPNPVLLTADGSGNPLGATSWFPSISGDGRYIVFTSMADLGSGSAPGRMYTYIYDTSAQTFRKIDVGFDGSPASKSSLVAGISSDGHTIGFSSNANNLVTGDTNKFYDAFVVCFP